MNLGNAWGFWKEKKVDESGDSKGKRSRKREKRVYLTEGGTEN